MIKHWKIQNMMVTDVNLLQWFINFLKACGGTVKNEIISNKELAEKLHKPIIRNFKKRKVHSPLMDNIWGIDLTDMQLIVNLIKDLHFYYVLLICKANMHGFFHKIKNEVQLLMLFKNF